MSFDAIRPAFVFTLPCVSPTARYGLNDHTLTHVKYAGTTELRRLDGVEREHQDDIFGFVIGCSSRTPLKELKEEWLKTGWSEDTVAHPLVYARGTSNTEKSGLTWTAHQVRMVVHVSIGWILIFLKDLGIPNH